MTAKRDEDLPLIALAHGQVDDDTLSVFSEFGTVVQSRFCPPGKIYIVSPTRKIGQPWEPGEQWRLDL